eukprot:12211885-Alexandrium_andersonii.AAC.1
MDGFGGLGLLAASELSVSCSGRFLQERSGGWTHSATGGSGGRETFLEVGASTGCFIYPGGKGGEKRWRGGQALFYLGSGRKVGA